MHPLWEEYTWPVKDFDDRDVPRVAEQPCFYMNPYSGDLSLEFPAQEQHCLGGILADEMGLGKTIQMLSLIHSHRSEVAEAARQSGTGASSVVNLPRLPASTASVVAAPRTTLVVAPMSLLAQWQSEAENASEEGTLKSMVYYGSDKVADLRTLCCEANAATAPDVIVTSYGIVLSEFTQIAAKGGSMDGHHGLFSLNFFRIILDEAHSIKNRQSKTAKACYELSAEHRWVLTGTPIVNKLEDLFSLVRFLKVEPWNNFSFWRTFITVPFESGNFVKALDVVQTVLEPLVMRVSTITHGLQFSCLFPSDQLAQYNLLTLHLSVRRICVCLMVIHWWLCRRSTWKSSMSSCPRPNAKFMTIFSPEPRRPSKRMSPREQS